MNPLQRYRAMEAFCRQHSKMEGEDELFWLTEADVLAKLATNAIQGLEISPSDIADVKVLPAESTSACPVTIFVSSWASFPARLNWALNYRMTMQLGKN
jgi:hypothetical protein